MYTFYAMRPVYCLPENKCILTQVYIEILWAAHSANAAIIHSSFIGYKSTALGCRRYHLEKIQHEVLSYPRCRFGFFGKPLSESSY